MKNKMNIISIVFLMLFSILFISNVYSIEDIGNERLTQESFSIISNPEGIIVFLSSFLALILFLLTLKTYLVDNRKKFLFLTIAFGLFATKGFILSSELFIPELSAWVEIVANLLDFAILISFFIGIIKK